MKKVSFSCHDFGMFDGEFNTYDYEFFFKHTGAFERFLKDESKEQKQNFLDAFCEFFQNHGEMKAISRMKDHKKRFVDSFKLYALDNFVNGKLSAARQFLNDTVVVAKNKHMIHFMDSQSYTKDPFFNRETRDVFRRLFGEPSESGTCIKVICLLPLYITFAGAICRYLRRWLEADEVSAFAALKCSPSSKPQKGKKKDEVKPPKEEEKPKEKEKPKIDDSPAVMVFKIDRDGVQETRRTPSGDHKFRQVNDPAYLERAGFPWPQMAVPSDEFRSRHEDQELQKQRRKEELMFNEHDRMMRDVDTEMMRIQKKKLEEVLREDPEVSGTRMVVIGDSKSSYLERKASQWKTSEDKGKTSEDKGKTSKGKKSGGKTLEEKMSRKKSEGKTSEVKISEVKVSEEKASEKQTSQEENGNTVEAETSEEKSSEEKSSEEMSSKTSESLSSERGTSEERISEEQISESQTSLEKMPEHNLSEEKSDQAEDGVVDMECDDNAADDCLIKEALTELHLGQPHPNEVYDDMVQSEKEKNEELESSSESDKRRLCAFCKSSEIEPKSFKKCQKCKGKGTKFYEIRLLHGNESGTE